MTKAYLVSLHGGGDTAIFFCNKKTWDWINSTETPGRKGNESGWTDAATPKKVSDALIANGDSGEVYLTIGSYDNDRALYAMHAFDSFDSVRDAMSHAKKNNIEIVDEYEGCIY